MALSLFNARATLISSFQAGDDSWHLGTLAVGQLDNAPDLEIIVPYRDASGAWFLDAFKYTGARLPGFPYSSGGDEINGSPTIFDLDGDARDEIIFTRGSHVIALRADGSVMWSNRVSSADYVPNGGYQTLTNGFYWSDGGGFIHRLPPTAVFSSQVSPPIVADVNGDGTDEIVTAWKINPDPGGYAQDFNPFVNDLFGFGEWGTVGETWSGGVIFFDALTGRREFVYHLHQLVEGGLAIGRAEAKTPLDVYVLNDSDSVVCFDKTKPFGLWGSGMLHKQFGKNQRLMTSSYQQPIDVYTADIDGDSRDEALVAGTQLGTLWQPNETILDDDGAILWRRWLPHAAITHQFGWHNSASLIPLNPDHDNHVDVLGFNHSHEITFRYWNGIELADHPGWPKDFYPLLPAPPVVGDVDGDGAEEIIIAAYNPALAPSLGSVFVYSLNGVLEFAVPVLGGIKHIPALADVTGDGQVDLVYRSLPGRVYVHNFGSGSAQNVSWATHRGNFRRDGNRQPLLPPGTPLVTTKLPGFRRATFGWTHSQPAQAFRIFRAQQPGDPFEHVVTVSSNVTSYTDTHLRDGWQYLYEVGAVYATNTVRSSPFAITALLNSNLVANAGFEENDNSHWDKWYSGKPTNMLGSQAGTFQGRQSMRVILENQAAGSSISQFNQYGIPNSTLPVASGAFYSFGGWLKSAGMSQPGEHWIEWSSTRTATDTNARPALPWPNYFTPHAIFGNGADNWIYANRVLQMPPGLPNVELAHRYSMTAPASGSFQLDNFFFRRIPAPTATNWTTLVPFGATWHYSTNTPPAIWTSSQFNPAAWPVGTAKFGAGSGPTNVTTPLPPQKPAYYFRKTFVANTRFEELLLHATCTDEYGGTTFPLRLFLNGAEVKSSGIETVTGQGNEKRYFDLTPFVDLLRLGTNTIAIQLGNAYAAEWDDVAFDVTLRGIPRADNARGFNVVGRDDTGIRLRVEVPAGTMWHLQSCEKMRDTDWGLVETILGDGGVQMILDSGQNGRPLPSATQARFYRMLPY